MLQERDYSPSLHPPSGKGREIARILSDVEISDLFLAHVSDPNDPNRPSDMKTDMISFAACCLYFAAYHQQPRKMAELNTHHSVESLRAALVNAGRCRKPAVVFRFAVGYRHKSIVNNF